MRKTQQIRIFKKVLILAVFFCILLCYYIFALQPIIKTYCISKISSITEQSLNLAVSNVINSTLNYNSIVNVSYNEAGEVAFISANQYAINTITREVVKDAHERMKSLGEEYLKVPLGTLSGIAIFMGRGPNVKLSATPISIIGSSFDSNFISTGINNTLHKIYLTVIAKVEMTLPIKKQQIEVKQQVLLCESVIIGQVPKVYLNSGMSEKILNLVP